MNKLYSLPAVSLLLTLLTAACARGTDPAPLRAAPPAFAPVPWSRPAPLPVVPPLHPATASWKPGELPRIAVRARVSSARDNRLQLQLTDRARAALDRHPEVTTDLEQARLRGVPIVSLDTSAQCDYRRQPRYAEVDCGLRFALSNDRSRMLSTWRRSLSLTGGLSETRDALVDAAIEHAVRELPDRLLLALDQTP